MRRHDARPLRWVRISMLLATLVISSCATQAVAQQGESSADARYLAGLRDRGLFELGEAYCVQRLRASELADSSRAELVVELSRTLAEQAVNAAPDKRQPLWQQARQVVEDFASQYPQSPRLSLVRFQGALSALACGELARRESQVVVDREPLIGQARKELRTAIRQLESLNQEIEQELRERNTNASGESRRKPSDRIPLDQLTTLQLHLQYQLARAYRNQAECYPAESPDRSNSLLRAIKMLEPLASLDAGHSLAWKSRLDLIGCHRLLADYPATKRLLEALFQEQTPASIVLRGRAEQIRLALAEGQLPEALRLVGNGRESNGATSPDLDSACLETYLAAWQAANEAKRSEEAGRWQTKATELVQLIEQTQSPYWVRQAQMMLASSVQSSPGTADLTLVVRAAENAFRGGQMDEALAAYDRARALAEKAGDKDRAFDLGYVAATIEHQRGRHEQAFNRYRQIALASPQHPKALEAHSLAIFHAAQLAKTETPEALHRYAATLEEHAKTWPEAADANDMRRRLGRLRQLRHDWAGAITAYRDVSPDDPQFLAVIGDLEQCSLAWFAERKAAGESPEKYAASAAAWFESIVLGPQGRVPERWSDVQRQAALAAARIRMTYTSKGYQKAADLLGAALADTRDVPADWTAAAQSLMILALAGQGRFGEASDLLAQLAKGAIASLPNILEGLTTLAGEVEPRVRVDLARLELRTIDLLQTRRQELTPEQQQALERCRAQALADSGRNDDATAAYAALAERYPRDAATQEAYARLLATRQDAASLQAALAKWQAIAQKSETASPRWFRAQYAVASLDYRLGKKDMAIAIVKRLKVLYPDMGGPEMKAQLLELLDRCQR